MADVDLMGLKPGGDVGVGPEAARPQPTDSPGDRSGGWVKVGAGYEGGRQFDYGNSYYGGDSPPWRHT